MKAFMKVYLISFVGFAVLFSAVFIGADRFYFSKRSDDGSSVIINGEVPDSSLKDYLKNGKRLNLLLIGSDGGRSDTMMVVSLSLSDKDIKILSVPRDTYYHLEGYDAYDQRKLNAVYGHGNGKGGVVGVKKAVAEITGMELPYYIEVDYDAVMEIVDLVGGVEFEVPFDMNYDDPYAKPPLHIHLKKGIQVLDGEKAMQFLRWRKNNGSEGTGDIDRIKRQQAFMTAAAKKAFGLKLPMVIKAAYENVETNLGAGDLIYLGTNLIGTDLGAIEKHTMPGKLDLIHGFSYMVPDKEGIKALVEAMNTPKAPDESKKK